MAVVSETVVYVIAMFDTVNNPDEEVASIRMSGVSSLTTNYGVDEAFAESLRDWVAANYSGTWNEVKLYRETEERDTTEIL